VIQLEDHEKFKDNDSNILHIETRCTERKPGCVFFKVNVVSIVFDMPKLQDALIHGNSKYIKNIDYKYFSCVSPVKNGTKTSKKIKVENKMFLTYEGMLRVLFV
jgi:hypothetical protein